LVRGSKPFWGPFGENPHFLGGTQIAVGYLKRIRGGFTKVAVGDERDLITRGWGGKGSD